MRAVQVCRDVPLGRRPRDLCEGFAGFAICDTACSAGVTQCGATLQKPSYVRHASWTSRNSMLQSPLVTFLQKSRRQLMIALVAGVVLGCFFGAIVFSLIAAPTILSVAFGPSPTPTHTATFTPTQTSTPTMTATFTPTPLPTATFTSTPLPTVTRTAAATRVAAATATRAPTRAVALHFMVGRPVPPNVAMIAPDPIYLYGTTRYGDLDVHHGEEFENPIGTPLYAVADGTVVVAGSDVQPICGDNGKTVCGRDTSPDSGGYYGKLVVIQLARDYQGQRVFALYGHMNQISVQKGDAVKQGSVIGNIGSSGVALGPHVHFEVRLGVNDYAHTRNPILWMTPLPGRGSLAGRYLDANDNPIRGAIVNFYRASGDFLFATETYSRDRWPLVNDDDEIGENFAMGDLPVGEYLIKIQGQQFAQRVTIQDGKLSVVDIGVP